MPIRRSSPTGLMMTIFSSVFSFFVTCKYGCNNCDGINCIAIKSNRKTMNRNWSNQKANPALKTKAGNK